MEDKAIHTPITRYDDGAMIDGDIEKLVIDGAIKYTRRVSYELDKIRRDAIKMFANELKKEAIDCDLSFGLGRECYQEVVPVIVIDKIIAKLSKAGDDEE